MHNPLLHTPSQDDSGCVCTLSTPTLTLQCRIVVPVSIVCGTAVPRAARTISAGCRSLRGMAYLDFLDELSISGLVATIPNPTEDRKRQNGGAERTQDLL